MKTYNRREVLQFLGGTLAATSLFPACTPPVRNTSFTPATTEVESFLQLSSVLTGELKTNLDIVLALEYMQRLEKKAEGVLDRLLAKFQDIVVEAGGDQLKLIALVEAEIWCPGDCATITYGGQELCDVSKTPECCLARDIPLLWYAGVLMEKTSYMVPTTQFVNGSTASYLGALSWKIAGAHPQAQCGGRYGYWASEPGEPYPTRG